ncbi:hypothetical protein GQ600_1533 [Phytophthora cactorum]|nr:hypothetical protein GQ600_1533 [Phytophthora cactorum]
MDCAARLGSLDVVKWLHENRSDVRDGYDVKWLHTHDEKARSDQAPLQPRGITVANGSTLCHGSTTTVRKDARAV